MILKNLGRIISWPFRAIFKLFMRGAKMGPRGSAAVSRTAAKTSGSAIAKKAGANVDETAVLDTEYRDAPPSGIEAAMFTQLPRPRLTEKSASDLTIEQAQSYAEQAQRFYEYNFPLFPRGDFFYEEIEEEFLNAALGFGEQSIDRRFIEVTTLFRKTLNANTRRMLLYWAPAIGLAVFAAAIFIAPMGLITGPGGPAAQAGVLYGAAALVGAALTFLVYSWPYKVVQQRNLMNLDNYVTSKFARINNNFQVAKRRALNVERDKRMSERDALKDEAGAWTLSYHWFASRLFLCETMLRNKFYQVRRNTTLYWVGGMTLCTVLFAGIGAYLVVTGAELVVIGVFAAAAGAYLVAAGAITARATGMMFGVLQSNEWSRFHIINLDRTIRDHVGEDKLQIVTFRDRNRLE